MAIQQADYLEVLTRGISNVNLTDPDAVAVFTFGISHGLAEPAPYLIPTNYRPNTIRNIIVALINEFKGLKVENFSGSTITQVIDVPVQFGHMDKYHLLNKETESGKKYYLNLPKISIEWNSIVFNGERYRGREQIRHFYNTELPRCNTPFINDVNPIPYDLGFSVEIMTQNLNHFSQLAENILPFFDPARHLRVKEFSFLNIERDIKVRNEGMTPNILMEQSEENRRYVNGTIQLTVEAWLYRPLSDINVIREIRTRYMQDLPSYGLSAMAGYNTSGWDSTVQFPLPYDSSGTFSADNIEFDYYIDDIFN
jgi:hypothetical protein